MTGKLCGMIVIAFISQLLGCTHPHIGKTVKDGGYSLGESSQNVVDFGDDLRLTVIHEASDFSIHISGSLECKKTIKNSLHNWDQAEFKINFYFLDDLNTVVDVKTMNIYGKGEVCEIRKFEATFPTSPRYRKVNYKLTGRLMAY